MAEVTTVTYEYTGWFVPVTYSFCTNYTDGSTISVPPSTTIGRVSSTPSLSSVIPTPISTYLSTETFTGDSRMGVYPVAVFDPTDVDALDFASASTKAQPYQCLTATASEDLDYRSACEGSSETYRMEQPTGGVSCGELNPCCFDCLEYEWRCLFGDCTDDPRVGQNSYKCADGKEYFEDGDVRWESPETRIPTTTTSTTSSTSRTNADSPEAGEPTGTTGDGERDAAARTAKLGETWLVALWVTAIGMLLGGAVQL